MTPRRILVVDPDPDWRTILRTFLVFKGWRVFEAEDASTALTLAGRERPDAVICEPKGSGFELVSALRHSLEFSPPVVVVTTLMDPDSGQRAAELDCALLLKPISFETVLATVERVMVVFPGPREEGREIFANAELC